MHVVGFQSPKKKKDNDTSSVFIFCADDKVTSVTVDCFYYI